MLLGRQVRYGISHRPTFIFLLVQGNPQQLLHRSYSPGHFAQAILEKSVHTVLTRNRMQDGSIRTGEYRLMHHPVENKQFMNAGATPVGVMVEFFDKQGNALGIKSDTIAPYSSKQWNNAYTLGPIGASNIAAGFADVWTDTPDANFLTYGSVVDNGTDDPTTVWPF